MNAPTQITSQTTSPPLLREDHGDVAVLTLNRPEQRNPLSEGVIVALSDQLHAIAADSGIRVVIIAAAGPAFSAGHDLKELASHRSDPDRGRAYFKMIMEASAAVMQSIVHLPQPVIAAVEGIAGAAGCQLVASCDLAVAGAHARFSTPGVNIGLFCSTPMVSVSRNVPRKAAMHMLLTGDMMDAEEARRIALVNDVVPEGTALDGALALARKIAAKPRAIVKIGKQAFYRQAEMSLADAYAFTADVMVENMLARDAEEGIGAFIEKRDPEWDR
jgi:enoyl-CoA hydratase/carnithine racemase